jgi:hypothetical protein
VTQRECMARWRAKNRDKLRAHWRRYRQRHPDRVRASQEAWRARTTERIVEEWYTHSDFDEAESNIDAYWASKRGSPSV